MGMDATKVMKMADQFISAKGRYDTVKGVDDTIKKIDKEMKKKPGAQNWANILMKRDATLDKCLVEFRWQTKTCLALIKTKVDWPKDQTEKMISAAAKTAKKDGIDSKRIKKIVEDLEWDLNKQNFTYALTMRSAKIQGNRCEKRIKTIKQTKKYLKMLEANFMAIASFGISSSVQAEAFSYARHCFEVYSEAGKLESALIKLRSAYKDLYAHADKLNKSVDKWLSIAGSDGLKHEIEQQMR